MRGPIGGPATASPSTRRPSRPPRPGPLRSPPGAGTTTALAMPLGPGRATTRRRAPNGSGPITIRPIAAAITSTDSAGAGAAADIAGTLAIAATAAITIAAVAAGAITTAAAAKAAAVPSRRPIAA